MTALGFDPTGISLDRALGGLSRQLYQALRERILAGRMAAGTRLPASRDLAGALGVSRNTVVRAFDQLYAEGFVEGHVGNGTYVSAISKPVGKLSTNSSTGLRTGLSTGLSTEGIYLSSGSAAFAVLPSRLGPTPLAPLPSPRQGPPKAFRLGVPALDLFPFAQWAKLQSHFWRNPDPALLGYGDPAGYRPLRELVGAYLRASRGLNCTTEQIVITTGAQQAISLCAQLLLSPGDSVAVENPGYRAAAHAFAAAGARLQGVRVDTQGLDCAALPQSSDCRLAYVTPAHQYPTGVTLSLARRLELLAWAEQGQRWIIEDDYDSEYRYSDAPLAPLAALDRAGRVIYVGTFGKVAFPALRLGYLVLPQPLVEPFTQRQATDIRHSDTASQAVMAAFMGAGHFQRHIRRMRKAALSRRNALIAQWPASIDGCAALPEIHAGLHVKIAAHSFASEQRLVAQAEQVGVEVTALSDYWLPDSPTPLDDRAGLLLGFAAVEERYMAQAIERLRSIWRC